ncbi:MAG: PKD domain-containing protein, partial [Dehalococcoidales bacterium]|nr:PKD domain-containing protein [Dehalococcoidales bacterium]
MKTNKFALLNLILAAVFVIGTSILPAAPAMALPGSPLTNSGFEEGIADGAPVNWTVDSVADAVKVADTESASEFPIYGEMNVASVVPYRDELMLRIGAPKNISEKQEPGDNTVSQQFTPNSSSLKLSFRLFSWENRGNDVVRIDLKPAGSPNAPPVGSISFTDPDPSDGSVNIATDSRLIPTVNSGKTILWEVSIGLPRRGDYLDTGWIEAEISGLTPGQDLVLSYTVGGTKNSSFATWGYFDNVNTPPVARFHYEPTPALEGGRLKFIDESYDPDEPEDTIVSWQWIMYGPLERGTYLTADNSTRYLHDNRDNPWNAQNPVYIPSDQGTYVVQLTVTDTRGESTTVTGGDVAIDGTPVPELVVLSTPPKVNALSVEVHEGDKAVLFGRFLDHGWLDTHKAAWEIPGIASGDIPTILREDLSPFTNSGSITGIIDWQTLENAIGPGASLPSSINAKLRVWEVSGGSENVTADFTVKVIPANSDEHEENSNDIQGAPELPSNWIYSSYLNPQGDFDLFEIKRPDDSSLAGGSEVLVTLKDVPSDYDLILLARFPDEGAAADFDMSDFDMSDFDMSDFDMSDFDMSD